MLGFERAFDEANNKAPHLAALARDLLGMMPRRPLASQNVRAITLRPSVNELWLEDAIACPWICPNSRRRINALLIDIDHADGSDLVDLLPPGCPRPTLVIDPHSGRAHAILPLATPVLTGEGARSAPQHLAKRVLLLMAAALRGTPLPQVTMVKSPWGLTSNLIGSRRRRTPTPVWEAHQEHTEREGRNALMWITQQGSGPAELGDIVAALDGDYADEIAEAVQPQHRRKHKAEQIDPAEGGRNVALFKMTSRWAYDSCEREESAIQAEATRINAGFPIPLPASEVAATARSICSFMNTRFRPRFGSTGRRRDFSTNRGMDARARLAFAGRRTAECRGATTGARITAARAQLKAAGERVTQAAIAARAGVSVRTVQRHKDAPGQDATHAYPIRYGALPDATLEPATEAYPTPSEPTEPIEEPIEAKPLPIIDTRRRSSGNRRTNSRPENRRPAASKGLARSESGEHDSGNRPDAPMTRSAAHNILLDLTGVTRHISPRD
jgi:hypothetical protein